MSRKCFCGDEPTHPATSGQRWEVWAAPVSSCLTEPRDPRDVIHFVSTADGWELNISLSPPTKLPRWSEEGQWCYETDVTGLCEGKAQFQLVFSDIPDLTMKGKINSPGNISNEIHSSLNRTSDAERQRERTPWLCLGQTQIQSEGLNWSEVGAGVREVKVGISWREA